MEAERELFRGAINKIRNEEQRGEIIVTNQRVTLRWQDDHHTEISLSEIRIIFANKNIRETGAFSRKIPGMMIDWRHSGGGRVEVLETPDAAEIVDQIKRAKPGL